MSEYYKEQHPLLCEEISEEEHYSPRYHRRLRPSGYRGRARTNLKGAASIITRWPDHWSSFLAYWWIGLGMISLMTFIVYNSLFAFSMLPTANLKPASLILAKTNDKSTPKIALSLPDVYMHVFVEQSEEIDFNKYIPYIEELANKYNKIKFHFIVIVNDTNLGWLSAEENNEIALNSLWSKGLKKVPIHTNVAVEYITLSAYMENSPLKKYWMTLPHQLIKFLVRSVSIWDKGGIAFDPNILTPKSEHAIYIDKLHNLLNKYADFHTVGRSIKKTKKLNKAVKKERKLNNIRDIINALENEDESVNTFSQQSLTEAENVLSPVGTKSDRHVTAPKNVAKSELKNNTEDSSDIQIRPQVNSVSSNTKELKHHYGANNSTESTLALHGNHNTTKLSLLPLFLEFIFHNKLNVKPSSTEATIANRTRKSVVELPKSEDAKSSLPTHALAKIDKKVADTYKPIIISAAGIYNTSEYVIPSKLTPITETDEISERDRLTIDLKGNIIATDVPCHAFLGTIFSNAIHHSEEESVTDFIIAELTIFCKGLLSSCMGIDLILL